MTSSAAALLTMSGALLLLIGLARDLWIKYRHKNTVVKACRMRAICVESLSGFSAVGLGGALQLLQWTPMVHIHAGFVAVGAVLIAIFQYTTRHWVVVLEKVADHRSIHLD